MLTVVMEIDTEPSAGKQIQETGQLLFSFSTLLFSSNPSLLDVLTVTCRRVRCAVHHHSGLQVAQQRGDERSSKWFKRRSAQSGWATMGGRRNGRGSRRCRQPRRV